MALFLLIMIILWLVAYKIVSQKFGIKQRLFYKPVSKLQQQSERLLLIFCLIILTIIAFVYHGLAFQYFALAFTAILLGFRAFMEWKYERSSRQYMISGISVFMILIILGGSMIISKPQVIAYTHHAFMYSECGTISEPIEIEILGQLKPHIFYGCLFEGQMNVIEKEFFLTTFGIGNKESIIDRVTGKSRRYIMIELTGNDRGEVWTSKDFHAVAGIIRGKAGSESIGKVSIMFAAPAASIEEAKDLINLMISD